MVGESEFFSEGVKKTLPNNMMAMAVNVRAGYRSFGANCDFSRYCMPYRNILGFLF